MINSFRRNKCDTFFLLPSQHGWATSYLGSRRVELVDDAAISLVYFHFFIIITILSHFFSLCFRIMSRRQVEEFFEIISALTYSPLLKPESFERRQRRQRQRPGTNFLDYSHLPYCNCDLAFGPHSSNSAFELSSFRASHLIRIRIPNSKLLLYCVRSLVRSFVRRNSFFFEFKSRSVV